MNQLVELNDIELKEISGGSYALAGVLLGGVGLGLTVTYYAAYAVGYLMNR